MKVMIQRFGKLPVLLCAAMAAGAEPPDFPSGSISPSGRYEVRRCYDVNAQPSGFTLHVVEKDTGRTLGAIATQLPFSNKADKWNEILLWHPHFDAFALLEPRGRWGNRLRFLSVAAGSPEEVEIPDHVMNILGRIGSVRVERYNITRFVGWHANELEVTWFGQGDAEPGAEYTSTVRFRIEWDEGTARWLARLSRVIEPVGTGGRSTDAGP